MRIYQKAFGEATELPLTLRPIESWQLAHRFRKATGLTFTDYLGRVRVEKAKTLLLNPHLRVSEIAYTVGFQSLTHFNRVFHNLTGESPTLFRANGTLRDRAPARAVKLGGSQRKVSGRNVCAGVTH